MVAAVKEYGRGADIRFKVDSFVVIAFLPTMYDNVLQMTGRSSRTMGNHKSKLIAIHEKHLSEGIEDFLKSTNHYNIEDGLEVSSIMLGRRLSKENSDAPLLKAFKHGWKFPVKRIRTILGEQKVIEYLQEAEEYQKNTLLV